MDSLDAAAQGDEINSFVLLMLYEDVGQPAVHASNIRFIRIT